MYCILAAKQVVVIRRKHLSVDGNRLRQGLRRTAGGVAVTLVFGKTVYMRNKVTSLAF